MNKVLCTENVSAEKKRLIRKELLKGHEAATQLKLLLENPSGNEPSFSSESSQQPMINVLRSFTQALAIINSSSFSETCSPHVVAPYGDSTENRSQKCGRGRYNRRKGALTWTTLSYTTDDKHAWRKYGQKEVLNSQFPRSYFRCCHKYDQGCLATKQVQMDQENPVRYRTTYIGIHTCDANLKTTDLVTDSATWETYLVNSDSDSKLPMVEDHQIRSLS